MSNAIDDFCDYHKDVVTNTSTGLMAIRDLATYYNVPIDIHFIARICISSLENQMTFIIG